jgi:hypothetical protein
MADQDNVVRRADRPKVQNPKAAAPAMGADSGDMSASEEMGFFKTMGRLLMKHNATHDDAQEHAAGGLARRRKVDELVDDAVNGAKDDPI